VKVNTGIPAARDITRTTLAVLFIGPAVLAITFALLEAWVSGSSQVKESLQEENG
jgi:hypothetical protein